MNKKILKTKKAFTFAELMISLVIVGVITLLMYPTVSDLAPNNNKFLFKETYQTITMIVSDHINAAGRTEVPTSQQDLCTLFCKSLNTRETSNANGTCENCTTFTTSNGMRWAFSENANIGYVLVDVNVSNNNSAPTPNTFPAILNFTANQNPWDNNNNTARGIFYTGETKTQDTFLFRVTSTGAVEPLDGIAMQHLQSGDNN